MKLSRATPFVIYAAILAAIGGAIAWRVRGATSPQEQFEKALTALARGDIESVRAIGKVLRDEYDMSDHDRFLRAAALLSSGEPQKALQLLERLRDNPQLGDLPLRLAGQSFHKLERYVEAANCFRQAAQQHPDDPVLQRWLATVYYDLGDLDLAESHLKKLCELQPDDWRPWHLRGQLEADFARNDQSAVCFREALDRNPPEEMREVLRVKLAEALLDHNQYAEAEAVLSDCQDTAKVEALRGSCRIGQGDLDAAAKRAARALTLNSAEPKTLLLNAKVAAQRAQWKTVVEFLEPLLNAEPHNAEARYQLAIAYKRLHRDEDFNREIAKKEASEKLFEQLRALTRKATVETYNAEVRDELADVCDKLAKPKLATMWRVAADACRSK